MIRAALAAAAFALSLAAGAANVAFVADIRGNATIEGNGKLGFLAELAAGTRLLLGSNATAAITFAATGTEFTITGPGEYLVTASEVKAEKGVAPVKRAVMALPDPGVVTRVSQAATASVRMRGLKPPAEANPMQYPVDASVATLQPVLRWREGAAAEGAMVRVSDESGKEIWTGKAQAGSARPGVKLSPATRYTWTIMTPRGVPAQAQFQTLSADAVAKAEKSRLAARSFSDRVLHAFLLQDIGAAQDAREAWAALARERPDLPELQVLAR